MLKSQILAELKRNVWAMDFGTLQSYWHSFRGELNANHQPQIQNQEATKIDAYSISAAGIEKFTPAQDRKTAAKPGSVAVIPLIGVIDKRDSFFLRFFGGTSVDNFAKIFTSYLADSQIKAIIIDVDSPGGSVSGVPELAQLITESRGTKPIIAQVNSLAASAGYWLAAAADEIVITPSGEAGSIGVYTLHEDISAYLENMGIKETFIYAGDNKVEGNPYEPISDDAKAHTQSIIDDFYDMFVSAVANMRGKSVKEVNENFGQGRVFGSKEAVKRGLADRVDTLQGTLARYGVSLYADSTRRRAMPVERMKREVEFIKTGIATKPEQAQ